jgi:hypothetical protein
VAIVQTLQRALEYPRGLWVSGGRAYYTETADHNTTFGGRRRLSRYTLDGGAIDVLADNPINSDALVVTGNLGIYLASYVGSIPGNSGRVSVGTFDIEAGWSETPVATVETAVSDMYLDQNEDIYLLGSNVDAGAKNLYRLPAGNYASPELLASGLGGSSSLTLVNGDIYYAVVGQVHSISDGVNQVVFSGPQVTTMTYDGTYLYYGTLDGNVRRRNLQDGVETTLFSGAGEITAVRYDAESQTLFFLRSGTTAAQYKDGSLNSIYLGPVIQ